MRVRSAVESDRERMLTSFAPMFGTWDYLHLVVDFILADSRRTLTFLAEDEDLLVMVHAYETEPGVWFLRGLRSNPGAGAFRVAIGLVGCCRAMNDELTRRGARRVRFGTLHYFSGSLRLARILGFREEFRLWHAQHRISACTAGPWSAGAAAVPGELLGYFLRSPSIRGGYYFTWWDTRVLDAAVLHRAWENGLLLEVRRNGSIAGAALLHHVGWQELMVVSIAEGDDRAVHDLHLAAIGKAEELGCIRLGLVHPSREEVARRQTMLGLPERGSYTVQLSRPARGNCRPV
jgi:hypothetical protein